MGPRVQAKFVEFQRSAQAWRCGLAHGSGWPPPLSALRSVRLEDGASRRLLPLVCCGKLRGSRR
eukprot:2335983-Lingulodinium_polyedra.AAC.1